jgi:hypothetical protein
MSVQTVLAVITSVVVIMMVGGAFVDSTHTKDIDRIRRKGKMVFARSSLLGVSYSWIVSIPAGQTGKD